jgi:hypothetical protein
MFMFAPSEFLGPDHGEEQITDQQQPDDESRHVSHESDPFTAVGV